MCLRLVERFLYLEKKLRKSNDINNMFCEKKINCIKNNAKNLRVGSTEI